MQEQSPGSTTPGQGAPVPLPQQYPPPQAQLLRTSSAPPEKRRKGRFDWIVLLIIGGALLTGAVSLIGSTTAGVNYKKVSFTTAAYDSKPVKISGLLVTPRQPAAGPMPAVVFAHGITVSKEWYIQMARPFAQEGIPVLLIDLRGHGGSTGSCTFCDEEPRDFWAAADYLRTNVPGVDPAHIVAMGHSLGGTTATRAGALQPDKKFSAVVAVYCWSSWKEAVEDLAGPIDAFVGRSWRFVTFARHSVDINSPEADDRYSILKLVDSDQPPNYMLALGRADELAPVETAEKIISKGTATVRNGEKLKAEVTYGSFADGTARKLLLTDDDHLTELVGGVITRQSIDWVKQDAGLAVVPDAKPPFLWLRIIGMILLIVAIALLVMGVLSLVRRLLFKVDDGEPLYVKPPWGEFRTVGIREVILYAGAVLGTSYLAMPLAKGLGIGPFIPYAGVNEMSVFFLARSLLLLPVLLAVLVIVVKRAGLTAFMKEELPLAPARYAKSFAYAILPLAVIMLIGSIIAVPLLLPRFVPMLPAYLIPGVVIIGGGFWMEDYLFYKLAYPALEVDEEEDTNQRLAILIHGLLLDGVFVAAFLPLMTMSARFSFQNIKIPMLVIGLLAIPFFLFVAFLSMRIRRVTGSSMAFALMFSSVAVWFLMAPIGVRGF